MSVPADRSDPPMTSGLLCDCGQIAMHDTWLPGGRHMARCCVCHVEAGEAPADWHPLCMTAVAP